MPNDPDDRPQAFFDALDQALRERESASFDPEALRRQHPEHADDVLEELAVLDRLESPGRMTPGAGYLDAPRGGGKNAPSNPLAASHVPSRLGDFELQQEIGRGGMGVVYAARQIGLEREVAVKLLPPGFAADEQLRRRFEREAELAARLVHPGIVRIYAFGENEGILYLAMERVDGASLQAVLAELEDTTAESLAKAVGAEMPPIGGFRGYVDAIVEIGAVVADALEEAHRGELVHRDVKPGNVLLDRRLEPHLADFGLARSMDSHSITASGQVLGTPGYLAPECVCGEPATAQSDVFALGATLYEAFSRKRPFDGQTTAEILNRVLTRDPQAIDRIDKRIPADIANVIQRALEKEPNRRYASAGALRDDLRRFQRGDPVSAVRIGAIGLAMRRARRRPRTAIGASILVLLVIALSTAWIASGIRQANETTRRHDDLVERAKQLESEARPVAAMEIYREAASLEDGAGPGTDAIARLAPIFKHERQRRFHELLLTEIFTSSSPVPSVTQKKLDEWVEESGNDRDGAVMRAVIAISRKNLAEALRQLDRASAIEPGQGVDYLRAATLDKLGRAEEARAARGRADASTPSRMEDYAIAAGDRHRQGDEEAAIDLLRRGQTRFPESPFLNYLHGWLCFLSWRYDEAISKYEQALLREPGLTVARQERGRCLLQVGRRDEAIPELRRVLEQRPDFTEAKIALADAVYRAPSGDRAANLEQAMNIIHEAFEHEQSASLHNMRGWLLAQSGKYPEAEADYRKALAIAPNHTLANANLAIFLRLSRRFDEYEEHVEDCLARPGLSAWAKIRMLNDRAIRYWTSDPERAEAALSAALRIRRTPNIISNLALLNLNQGRFETALVQLTEQIEKGYKVAVALCRRGYVRYRLVDIERAVIDQDLGLARAAEVPGQRAAPWMIMNRAAADAARNRFQDACRRTENERVLLATGSAVRHLWWRFHADGPKAVRTAMVELSPAVRKGIRRRSKVILDAWFAGLDGRFEEARKLLGEAAAGHRWPSPNIWIGIEWGARGDAALRTIAMKLLRNERVVEALSSRPPFGDATDEATRQWLIVRSRLRIDDPVTLVPRLEKVVEGLPYGICALELAIAHLLAGNEEKGIEALGIAARRQLSDDVVCAELIRAKIRSTPALRAWLSRGIEKK